MIETLFSARPGPSAPARNEPVDGPASSSADEPRTDAARTEKGKRSKLGVRFG